MYRAGKLDRRITLYKYAAVRTATGGVKGSFAGGGIDITKDPAYTLLRKVWGNYKNVPPLKSTAEVGKGGEWSADNYATWTLRYSSSSDLSVKDAIVDGQGLVYDILSISISNSSLRTELVEILTQQRRTK